ncbi:hypothetical protein V7S43_002835 [Phytophthora oleae]|uniref:Uncharacterized protein n=1 Tax=Phytophthora oleae TaxID=2107226 RepID=A0ABD3G0J5_9STRA
MDDQDAIDRKRLRGQIVLVRPNARLTTENPELRRSCLLYLLRLAPLTRQKADGVIERTSTGARFGLSRQHLGPFDNRYAAKFGYTQQTVKTALDQVVAHSLKTGFPDTELDPVYALGIIGLPHDEYVLQELEHGLRSYLSREAVCLGFSKRFEFVCTDNQGDRLFTLYQNYMRRLEAGRKEAKATVARQDIRRRKDIDTRRELLRMDQRRGYTRFLQQCRHAEALEQTRLQRAGLEDPEHLKQLHDQHERQQLLLRGQQLAAMRRIEADTPRVNVGQILADALITASLRE